MTEHERKFWRNMGMALAILLAVFLLRTAWFGVELMIATHAP